MFATWRLRHLTSKFNFHRASRARPRSGGMRHPIRFSIEALEDRLLPSTFSVLNTDDSGPGSLRETILDANARPGADVIEFAIPGPGVHTITPTSPLPDITDPVIIDGYTQPGASANTLAVGDDAVLLIQLDGTNAGVGANGLHLTGGYSTVRGLDVTNFADAGFSGIGILAEGNGSNVLEGNFFGIDPRGTASMRNGEYSVFFNGTSNNILGGSSPAARNVISGYAEFGVYVTGDHNVVSGNYIGLKADNSGTLGNLFGLRDDGTNTQIGGTTPEERNVISGSQDHGIILAGTAAVVEGNYIGTDATGMMAMPNGLFGIADGGKHNTIGGLTATPGSGGGNVISGNQTGIDSVDEFATFEGNIIGLNAAGTAALPNTLVGVCVQSATYALRIGGTVPEARNVISGNGGDGIWIQYVKGQFAQPDGGIVEGNYIGADVTGSSAIGNVGDGIKLDGAKNVMIGGTTTEAGNIISGNAQAGISITDGAASGNIAQRNYIGCNAAGMALSNGGDGVHIALGAHDNQIGDPLTGEGELGAFGNVIAFNGGAGVAARDATTINNSIIGNTIVANAGKGIDLTGSGVLIQPPTLLSVEVKPDLIVVSGTFTAQAHFRLPLVLVMYLFSQDAVAFSPSSFGFKGYRIITGPDGHFTFEPPFTSEPIKILITATDADGNTSEFSNPLFVASPSMLHIDATGHLTYVAGAGAANRLTISHSGGSYTFHDEGALILADTEDPVVLCSGSGSPTVTVSPGIQSISVDVGDQEDTVNVHSIAVPTTIDDTGGGDDTVNVGSHFAQFGGALSVQGIEAPLTVMNEASHTTLNVDDRADLFDHNVLCDETSLFGLAPATILYDPAILAALNVYGGSGANGFIVDDTPTNPMNLVTTLILGSSSSSVSALATSGPLTVDGVPGAAVNLGAFIGTVENIRGDVTITSPFAAITVDDSSNPIHHNATITDRSITGLAPARISWAQNSLGLLGSLDIKGGSGNNTFTIAGTPRLADPEDSTSTLHIGRGSDVVNVQATDGSLDIDRNGVIPVVINVGNAGSMHEINGGVTILNPTFTNLNLDDSNDSMPKTAQITNLVSGLAPAGILVLATIVNQFISLTVHGGSGGNTFNVGGTAPFSEVLLDTGIGNDTVRVHATQAPLLIDGQAGQDVVSVGEEYVDDEGMQHRDGLERVFGEVHVTNSAGATDLTIDDRGDSFAEKTILNADSVTVNGAKVSWDQPSDQHLPGIAALSIYVGGPESGNTNYGDPYTVDVENTGPFPTRTYRGAERLEIVSVLATVGELTTDGNDITVGTKGALGGGTLANVHGAVHVVAGLAFKLDVDDSVDAVPWMATIGATAISGPTHAPITYPQVGMSTLTIFGGSGGNSFTVASTPANTVQFRTGSSGRSTVNVQNTDRPLEIDGGSSPDGLNADVVNIGKAGSILDVLGPITLVTATSGFFQSVNVDDSASPLGRTATISNSTITGLAPATIYYSGAVVNFLNVQGGTGNDTFVVPSIPSGAAVSINGGGGSNLLQGPDVANAWFITGANAGAIFGITTFAHVQSLVGGAASDTFVFKNGGSVAGVLNGGGGANTLRYNQYTGDISVNLALNLASLVHLGAPGNVFNIVNVYGSIGINLIVGDANANVLNGGTGRNILIGGAGADLVIGGAGDNILIAGYTLYDQNLIALTAVMNEWASGDSYAIRIKKISDGVVGSDGNRYALVAGKGSARTAFDDAAVDILTCTANPDPNVVDWLFANTSTDQIVNPKKKDTIMPIF